MAVGHVESSGRRRRGGMERCGVRSCSLGGSDEERKIVKGWSRVEGEIVKGQKDVVMDRVVVEETSKEIG